MLLQLGSLGAEAQPNGKMAKISDMKIFIFLWSRNDLCVSPTGVPFVVRIDSCLPGTCL